MSVAVIFSWAIRPGAFWTAVVPHIPCRCNGKEGKDSTRCNGFETTTRGTETRRDHRGLEALDEGDDQRILPGKERLDQRHSGGFGFSPKFSNGKEGKDSTRCNGFETTTRGTKTRRDHRGLEALDATGTETNCRVELHQQGSRVVAWGGLAADQKLPAAKPEVWRQFANLGRVCV
jgi:hypothetical protein